MKKVLLFDWGNTIMRDFPDETGGMFTWAKVEAMPNVERALKELSRTVHCYIATNAKDSDKSDIEKALKRVGLNKVFKDIFCYREMGYLKPSKKYFDEIVVRLNVRRSEMMMIGDDLESDIMGAKKAGIDAVLYASEDKYPDYAGKRISDLLYVFEYLSLSE